MALIRGFGGLYPCPICLVPATKLSDLATRYPLRSAAQSQAIVEDARKAGSAAAKEELLKAYGLRGLDVCSLVFLLSLT